ncbi:hypothetical protein SAMN05216389_1395 [Oceanobacillus limi]|uniref:Yip1 domain-containing protein n=1 Tax=Oceanobacillus limi TaxID=930131 RepID=A0A1I0HNG9_9BACI|nr:hypothetical protein [Oceanobacillus limi]SET84691.1 hypothetical protein SAMN05216389_1395 [Oceanobacillus limi]
MTYTIHLRKLLFSIDDHLFRIGKAESLKNLWKLAIFLCFGSVIVYGWMAYLGIGSEPLSSGAVTSSPAEYELQKFWFIIGRMTYAFILALLVLFVPSLLFYVVTNVPYRKLIIMQLVVLLVMLVERILWVPLVLYAGLDWYVSPFSFGIIASYITDIPFLIYLFGSISIFQLWIIWFQIKFLTKLSPIKSVWVWVMIILFHISLWLITGLLTDVDVHLIGRWFG